MKYKRIVPTIYDNLFKRIASILSNAKSKVFREINQTQVLAYWEIGKEIVEFEQKGRRRAEYGRELIINLSRDMTEKFGRGFSERNLEQMRKFYLNYSQKAQTLSNEFKPILAWSHYCELLKPENAIKDPYVLGGLDNKVFASKYKLTLPSEKELRLKLKSPGSNLSE
ncbi:MAG: DUF1016 N-terminal domain-containing protein [Bacteroidota bacterium]|nr:DUF1016 N-terminal domain-containing protein [Bacteroidota bacterium]